MGLVASVCALSAMAAANTNGSQHKNNVTVAVTLAMATLKPPAAHTKTKQNWNNEHEYSNRNRDGYASTFNHKNAALWLGRVRGGARGRSPTAGYICHIIRFNAT